MFADDKSIENMQQLFIEFKKYLELQKEYTKLEVTEKLSKLLSTLLLVLLVVILGVVVLFHLSFTLVYILAPLVGGLMMSFALITCFHICLLYTSDAADEHKKFLLRWNQLPTRQMP